MRRSHGIWGLALSAALFVLWRRFTPSTAHPPRARAKQLPSVGGPGAELSRSPALEDRPGLSTEQSGRKDRSWPKRLGIAASIATGAGVIAGAAIVLSSGSGAPVTPSALPAIGASPSVLDAAASSGDEDGLPAGRTERSRDVSGMSATAVATNASEATRPVDAARESRSPKPGIATATPPDLVSVVHGWLYRSGVPQPDPVQASPPGPNPLIPLAARLSPLIERFDADAGVAVVDLQTGDVIDVNGQHQFQAASTIKFFATLSALQDIENGLYTYDAIAADLYGIMVLQSNEHARNLTLRTGIPTINRRLDVWGLEGTVIAHPSGYSWEQDPSLAEDDNDNLTTPSDAARGLELLYTAQIAEPDLSRTLINRMTQGPRWFGIEGAVPDGEGHVFYKVGWLPAYGLSSVNDIGIVEFQRGGQTLSYAIAIYTQGAVPQAPAWVLVRDLALASWDFFAYERYAPGSAAILTSIAGG